MSGKVDIPTKPRALKRPYAAGRAFEYRVLKALRDGGYFVMRSAGSHSAVDIVAVRRDGVLLIQCKRGGDLRPVPWNVLWDIAADCGATAIMARNYSGKLQLLRLLRPKGPQDFGPAAEIITLDGGKPDA